MSSSDNIARQELSDRFGRAVMDNPDVMAECQSLMRLYNLTASDLFFKYEAFVMSRPSGLRAKLSTITIDSVKELRTELQRSQQAKAVASMATASGPGMNESEKKKAVGVKKAKGLSDLEGLLGHLTTPNRPTKPQPSASSAISPSFASPASTTKATPLTTPQRHSPLPPTASSYRPNPSKLSSSSNVFLDTPMDKGANGLLVPSSPLSPSGVSPSSSPQLGQSFTKQANSNTVIETLNIHLPQLPPPHTRLASKPRVELSSTITAADYNYRYMFEKLSERSEALDDAIDEYADAIKDAYGLSELGDPHFVSDESIYTVGRILSNTTSSKSDKVALKNSFHLQSSRLIGAGKRIALELPEEKLQVRGGAPGVKGFSLYSGCLVCIKGRNGGGSKFVAEEILLLPPSLLPQTPASELIDFQYGDKLKGEPLSLMIAAGPYTLNENLLFEPFETLVDKVLEDRPDVFILLGPFIDSQHPIIKSCAVTETPQEIFRKQISRRLQKVVSQSPSTVIILVPSVRDVVSHHMAFPQSMLEKEYLGLPKKVKALPNPCTFSVNEVTISLSSVDILFHLGQAHAPIRAQEADPDPDMNGIPAPDPLANHIRQVLGQRSFYPIFPPPEDVAGEVNLDVTHYPLLKMDQAPDILILPSRLNKFAKIVDSTLVINPSHIARARATGHYAKIIIHPTAREILEESIQVDGEESLCEHQVYERARSEIWKI
ncbi:DNA polymerase alpha subunit B [Cryptococcus deuterogattii R265]|uniref:DNA polymerase alpha subunit B n=1 Tax=Cryptococcus deuterogattii (strain R265) TaxID=294750 RepID=UPI0019376EC3|nr:DNA polymerase alpha subunit B [Cryptococcus deuterogattii R265]